ncbi:hypothetical protein [Thiomicrorhabdus indica]|uniref:hypothetical protein n=1 Tax=Thiomicrorhabdus indica TaxID=2267253 RepID=UPI00102DE93A|nr:hypothetical protein [Thiomicrorhabdus indica]
MAVDFSVIQVELNGLPGAGTSRLINGLISDGAEKLKFQKSDEQHKQLQDKAGLRFWVLDVRQDLNVLQSQFSWLLELLRDGLQSSDAVILNFVEAADLTQQSQWQAFVRENFSKLPVFRSFYHSMPEGLIEFAQNLNLATKTTGRLNVNASTIPSNWQSFEFEMPRVSLEALMMALANSQQSMKMKIARIQATLQTIEYENRVALEVSGPLWKTFAAEDALHSMNNTLGLPNSMCIQGIDLDKDWLVELIHASRC